MTQEEKQSRILQQFLVHCKRSTRMAFGFLEVDQDVWDCPSNPDSVAKSMGEQFSVDELVASGLFEVKEDNSPKLISSLTGDNTRFIALCHGTENIPFELLTNSGCLSASKLSIFEILQDVRTQQFFEQGNEALFVGCDIEDVVMLRACGLAATLAVGLERLPLEDLDRFCDTFGSTYSKSERQLMRDESESENGNRSEYHPQDPIRKLAKTIAEGSGPPDDSFCSPDQVPVRLILLGWKPSLLAIVMPEQIKPIVDYFHELSRFMGIDLYEVGFWELDEDTIARLQFICDRRCATIFKEAFLDAADNILGTVMSIGQAKPKAFGPPVDYPSALTRYREACLPDRGIQRLGPDQRKQAWHEVQSFLNDQVINPIRAVALSADDPVERSLLMAIAELSNMFHVQSLIVNEQLDRSISAIAVEGGDLLPKDQLHNLLEITNRLIDMTKVLERCSQSRMTIIQPKKRAPNFPRLPPCG